MGCSGPRDKLPTQSLHLRLGDHFGREGGTFVRAEEEEYFLKVCLLYMTEETNPWNLNIMIWTMTTPVDISMWMLESHS